MSEETKELVEEKTVSDTEMAKLIEFIMGNLTEPPEGITKMMNNLLTKLSMGLGCGIVDSLQRQKDLADYLKLMEKKIFIADESIIDSYDVDTQVKLYDHASKVLTSLQEFQRKFIVQSRESLKVENSPQEKLMNKIMTLSPDKVEKLTEFLENLSRVETDKEEHVDL
jgi:hypothetical protein